MTDPVTVQNEVPEGEKQPGIFIRYIYSVFFWCLSGVALIYGIRIYHNAPIHPSFIPIIGAVFAAILSFTLVMTLKIVSGPIRIQLASFKLEGASGPIVLWCVCFTVICHGLVLLGITEASKVGPVVGFDTKSAGDLVIDKSPPWVKEFVRGEATGKGSSDISVGKTF